MKGKRQQKSQKFFWILSILVVLSMILSSVIFMFSEPGPVEPTPTLLLPLLLQALV